METESNWLLRHRLLVIGLLLLLTAAIPYSLTHAQSRGYSSRPCGFDLDDDGIIGEAGDCDICDGSTTDPDGDGTAEDLVYVDCDNGNDTTGTGAPGAPYATIGKAFSVLDGPGDGAEDIVCFKGTCTDIGDDVNDVPTTDGVSGNCTQTTCPKGDTTSYNLTITYPTNPAMLVGWDADGDGEYPPHDAQDVAVIDGGAPNWYQNGFFFLSNLQNWEFAHFTIQDFADRNSSAYPSWGNAGTFGMGGGCDYMYFHDLMVDRSCTGQSSGGAGGKCRTIYIASSIGVESNDWAFHNIFWRDIGTYWWRGSPDAGAVNNAELKRIRVQNNTVEFKGGLPTEPGGVKLLKVWGGVSEVELVDNKIDANYDDWTACGGNVCGVIPVTIAQCLQDIWYVNNEMIDTDAIANVQCYTPNFCTYRPTTNIHVLNNRMTSTTSHLDGSYRPAIGQVFKAAPGTDAYCGDIEYINNAATWTDPDLAFCILYRAGVLSGTNPGTVKFINNTCNGPNAANSAGGLIFGVEGAGVAGIESFIISNNVITGNTGTGYNIKVEYAPSSFDSDYNVFDSDGKYQWGGTDCTDLADWQASGGNCTNTDDAGSSECAPSFEADGYHLLSSDTCAKDRGTDGSPHTSIDCDNESRPIGLAWDVGADESPVDGEPQPPPSAPLNLRRADVQ